MRVKSISAVMLFCGIALVSTAISQNMKVELVRFDFENAGVFGESITSQEVGPFGWGYAWFPDSVGFSPEGRRCRAGKGINWGFGHVILADPTTESNTTYQIEYMVRNEMTIDGRVSLEFVNGEHGGAGTGYQARTWTKNQWVKDSISWTTPGNINVGMNAIILWVACAHNEGGILTQTPGYGYMDDAVIYKIAPRASVPPRLDGVVNVNGQPLDTTINAGESALFAVYANGLAPLSYQWYRNGEAIEGATARNLWIEDAGGDDNGAVFTCKVTNDDGEIESNPATLTVIGGTGAASRSNARFEASLVPEIKSGVIQCQLPSSNNWTLELRTLNGKTVGTARGHGADARIAAPKHAGVFLLSLTAEKRTTTTTILR